MKRTTALAAWITLAATLSPAAPKLKDNRSDDPSRILGQWAQESLSSHGNQPAGGANATFRFSKDGTCGIANGGQENGAQYSLEPTAKPKRLKWLNGPELTEWKCLYELDGDTLKVAFIDHNTEAPTQIEPTKNLTIYYLKRIKD